MNTSIMKASIKKELWEFTGMLTWIPVALGSVFIFIPLLILLLTGIDMNAYIEINGSDINTPLNALKYFSEVQYDESIVNDINGFFFVTSLAIFFPFILVGFIVQLYYFIACLYDERRDQSVMFWRSLPVSDTAAIASKLLTGAIIIPAIFYAAATALLLIVLVLVFIACVILSMSYDISIWGLWSSISIISTLGSLWLILIPIAVWLLPLFSWLMLTSIYAKKAPFLWAILPIVALLMIEFIVVYYLQLSPPFFGEFIADYFSLTSTEQVSMTFSEEYHSRLEPVATILRSIDYRTVIVSTILLFATYWIRVNKQES